MVVAVYPPYNNLLVTTQSLTYKTLLQQIEERNKGDDALKFRSLASIRCSVLTQAK